MMNINQYNYSEFEDLMHRNSDISVSNDRLKYYHPPFSLFSNSNKDNHQFFVVFGKPEFDKDYEKWRTPIIAITELKIYPGNKENQWSMPYITVDPTYQRTGLASELYRSACTFLKERNATLIRTANSESGICFQHVADRILFEHNVSWSQKGRRYGRELSYSGEDTTVVSDFVSLSSKLVYLAQSKNKDEIKEYLSDPLIRSHFFNVTDMDSSPFNEICKHIPELITYFDLDNIPEEQVLILLEDYLGHKNSGYANLCIAVKDKPEFILSHYFKRSNRLDIRDTNLWNVILNEHDKNEIETYCTENEIRLNQNISKPRTLSYFFKTCPI